MQRRSNIQVTSLLVFLSILTIVFQIVIYYYFSASAIIILAISCVISAISCHILLEQSTTYEACFIYSILTLFISLLITILSYFSRDNSYFPYSSLLIGIVAINWFVPTIHCFLRYMLDYGSRIDDYQSFFRNNSILFLLFYIAFLVYASFAKDAFPWAYAMASEKANFTPFWTLSSQIENYIYGQLPIHKIIFYLCSRILVLLPYGYYCTLLLRRKSRILRFLLLLLLPLTIEVSQYFIIPSRCDIDDAIFAVLGGILGALGFYLVNAIFRAISGRNFLSKENGYHFSNSSLHF